MKLIFGVFSILTAYSGLIYLNFEPQDYKMGLSLLFLSMATFLVSWDS